MLPPRSERRHIPDKYERPERQEDPVARDAWLAQMNARHRDVANHQAARKQQPKTSQSSAVDPDAYVARSNELNRKMMASIQQAPPPRTNDLQERLAWITRSHPNYRPADHPDDSQAKPAAQKDIAMRPIEDHPVQNDDSGFAQEATIFVQEHPVVEEPPAEDEILTTNHEDQEPPRTPLWRDDEPTTTLFEGLPDIRELFATIGNDNRKTSKETVLPQPAEKAFFKGLLNGLQQREVPSRSEIEIVSRTTDPQRKKLIKGVFIPWQQDPVETDHLLRINVNKGVIANLPSDEEIMNDEDLFGPYLLGLILAQRTQGRLPSRDSVWVKTLRDTFYANYSMTLGRVEKNKAYQTIVIDWEQISDVLKSRPSVQSLRFFYAIFPEAA